MMVRPMMMVGWYHVAAFAMILVWGISFLNTRVLLDAGLTPTEIFVARFTIAYLSLLVICRFKVRLTGWRDELLFVVCTACSHPSTPSRCPT